MSQKSDGAERRDLEALHDKLLEEEVEPQVYPPLLHIF